MKAIKLNLLKFKNACVLRIQGKTGKKACLVIPIEDAHLVAGEKGVYADLLECELKQPVQARSVADEAEELPAAAVEVPDDDLPF